MADQNLTTSWTPLLRRAGIPVLFYSLIMSAYEETRVAETTLLPLGIRNHKYLDGFVLFERQRSAEIVSAFRSVLGPAYVDYYTRRCRRETDQLCHIAAWLRRTTSRRIGNMEVAAAVGTYLTQAITTMTFMTPIVYLEQAIESAFDEYTAAHCSEAPDVLEVLKLPRRQPLPSQAMRILFEIARDLGSVVPRSAKPRSPEHLVQRIQTQHPEIWRRIEGFVARFDFMNMEYYAGKPLALSDVFAHALSMAHEAATRLNAMDESTRRQRDDLRRAARAMRRHPQALTLADMLAEVHDARQYRSDGLMRAGRDAWPLLERAASNIGISYSELLALTWSEAMTSIARGTLAIDHAEVPRRLSRYGVLLENGSLRIVVGTALNRELKRIRVPKDYRPGLSGKTVSRGRHDGYVKCAVHPDELKKPIPHGAIVVAPMIDPYFHEPLTKAGAIITEEGGVLNHAAIISREMQIPAIVGVRHATTLLKDGMFVTVDATGDVGTIFVHRKRRPQNSCPS